MRLPIPFRRTELSDRQETAVKITLDNLRRDRRSRFRMLACIDESDESLQAVRFAARLAASDECDIIIIHVRPIDQGLHSGGLQVRLARQNMMDAGFELPGVTYLKQAMAVLKEEGIDVSDWRSTSQNRDAWGDAAGDTKVEYKSAGGRSVVLKLKTAPDVAGGLLDQYELGPYNLMILGDSTRWRTEWRTFFGTGIVQSVATLAPCSVLVARSSLDREGVFICTDGTSRSMQAVRRAAVLSHAIGQPITLFSAAPTANAKPAAEEAVANAAALLKAVRIPVAETKVAVGPALQAIVEEGSRYRMIVVTDEGRSRLQRLIKGSLASDVVRLAKTSVLDVR
jgi:nucleotide-binding universal stress UspA family protein